MTKKRVFSGIKPSGELHIGNYIGAIKHWVKRQDEKENYFCVVDLHTITVPQDPGLLKKRIRTLTAWYIACGLDPSKSVVFVQSHNQDHAQMAWILNCFTSVGELRRMTQFKEKAEKQDFVSAGLLDYPVLMAADILLYGADEVPVGDDQKQHVEITRDIAQRFNGRYGSEILKLPVPVIEEVGDRVKSLQDPTSKMSKSEDDPMGTIDMLDGPDVIRKKIMRAVTDSGDEIRMGGDKPAMSNLLQIYGEMGNKSIKELEDQYKGKGYGEFKRDLAEVVVNALQPIQKRFREVMDSGEIEKILADGAERARTVSGRTLERVESVVGLG